MTCNICSNYSEYQFDRKVLNKYNVKYFKCKKCGFMQTEKPFWLDEAYSSAITNQDVGLISRNINLSRYTKVLLKLLSLNKDSKCLDYGGGYGLFVRLMRDFGYNFFLYDAFCDNLFAKGFNSTIEADKYNIVTAFEVFEHLEQPIHIISEILSYTDFLFFSTEIQPSGGVSNWWYVMEETGQHISFYSKESLSFIASSKGFYYYTNGKDLHIFSRIQISELKLKFLWNKYLRKLVDILVQNEESYLMSDYRKSKLDSPK